MQPLLPLVSLSIIFLLTVGTLLPEPLSSLSAIPVTCIYIAYYIYFIFFRKQHEIQINSYLIKVKHPFFKALHIYQRIPKLNELYQYSCKELHDKYESEMHQALDNLSSGTYKTVTQPIFTHGILHSSNVKILVYRKAYKRPITKLQRQVYLKRCKYCNNMSCVFQMNCRAKQFYYIKFIVTE